MKDKLAEQLLGRVMEWTPEDVAVERPMLQALAAFKYDEYQQFSPGMRFIESLALWLDQFKDKAERNSVYNFVKSRLIFISNTEMCHLISMVFPDYIKPFLIRQTAIHLGTNETFVTPIINSKEYKVLRRQSLFLGLSDGAHIDLFRRYNREISHEQIWQSYDISNEKAKDMLKELETDLTNIMGRKPEDEEKKFKTVFLLDDFSGSGLSYLRREEGKWKGKVIKVLRRIEEVFGSGNLKINVILYVATIQALKHLNKIADELKNDGFDYDYNFRAIQILPEWIKIVSGKDDDLVEILKEYFDSSILDKHIKKGKFTEPHFGFDQCALPLILAHNSPNNSLPLLWFEEHRTVRGLFPRVSRHREEI